MKFSVLTSAHLPELMTLEQACHSHPWSENTMDSCIGGRYFNQGLWINQQLVGFYIAEQAGDDICLMDICVHPQHQGQGLAQQLMNHLLAQATTKQAQNIFLEVRASNTAAINLYTRHEFIETGLRPNYYPSEQGREDAIVMARVMDIF